MHHSSVQCQGRLHALVNIIVNKVNIISSEKKRIIDLKHVFDVMFYVTQQTNKRTKV